MNETAAPSTVPNASPTRERAPFAGRSTRTTSPARSGEGALLVVTQTSSSHALGDYCGRASTVCRQASGLRRRLWGASGLPSTFSFTRWSTAGRAEVDGDQEYGYTGRGLRFTAQGLPLIGANGAMACGTAPNDPCAMQAESCYPPKPPRAWAWAWASRKGGSVKGETPFPCGVNVESHCSALVEAVTLVENVSAAQRQKLGFGAWFTEARDLVGEARRSFASGLSEPASVGVALDEPAKVGGDRHLDVLPCRLAKFLRPRLDEAPHELALVLAELQRERGGALRRSGTLLGAHGKTSTLAVQPQSRQLRDHGRSPSDARCLADGPDRRAPQPSPLGPQRAEVRCERPSGNLEARRYAQLPRAGARRVALQGGGGLAPSCVRSKGQGPRTKGGGVCSARMMRAREGFSKIRREHVEQAFREAEREGVGARGGSYFVKIGGKELPAKRVLRAAYRLANGVEISASSFSGGLFTAKVLEGLGVEVVVHTAGA